LPLEKCEVWSLGLELPGLGLGLELPGLCLGLELPGLGLGFYNKVSQSRLEI